MSPGILLDKSSTPEWNNRNNTSDIQLDSTLLNESPLNTVEVTSILNKPEQFVSPTPELYQQLLNVTKWLYDFGKKTIIILIITTMSFPFCFILMDI